MRFKSLRAVALMAFLVSNHAQAVTIPAGYDYFFTDPGSYFDFGSGIGVVNFKGETIGPGSTDTIVQRLSDATINGPAIPIQITALSLVSVAPVLGFGGIPVYISLDPNDLAQDTGTITINGSESGGKFDSFFDVFFDVCVNPGENGVGCGGSPLLTGIHKKFTSSGSSWSPAPPPNAVNASGDFFPTTVIHQTDVGEHVVAVAVTPIPSTVWLLISSIGGLGVFPRMRRITS